MIDRLKKGKGISGLTSLDCYCLFCYRYLLLCKHIFYKHIYGNKLLITDIWQMFHKIFEESGFEIYKSRESFIEYVQTEQQKNVKNRRLAVAERMRDRYWRVEEIGDIERMQSFISKLESSINSIILQFDK